MIDSFQNDATQQCHRGGHNQMRSKLTNWRVPDERNGSGMNHTLVHNTLVHAFISMFHFNTTRRHHSTFVRRYHQAPWIADIMALSHTRAAIERNVPKINVDRIRFFINGPSGGIGIVRSLSILALDGVFNKQWLSWKCGSTCGNPNA